MTAINTVAPALIAGNTVVLKHATQTLLVGERMAASIPQPQVGTRGGVSKRLPDPRRNQRSDRGPRRFDFVNFTGSVGGGQAMERAAAGTFTGVGLELGGKDPGYVMEDADLDAAVDTLIDGAMFNSGQCCCGIERIYVHESLYDAFVEKAVADCERAISLAIRWTARHYDPWANGQCALCKSEVRAQIAEAVADGADGHIATMDCR